MMKPQRELTPKEIRSIRKLVTTKCANYDKEYGCLPWTANAPCLVSAIPTAPCAATSGSPFCPTIRNCLLPFSRCPPSAVSIVESHFRLMGARCTAPQIVPMQPAGSRQRPGYESTEKRRWICNDYAPKKHCGAMTFRGCFHIPGVSVPEMQILPL